MYKFGKFNNFHLKFEISKDYEKDICYLILIYFYVLPAVFVLVI